MTINDQGNAAATTYTLTATMLARTGVATIHYNLPAIESTLTVNGGSEGTGDVMNVDSTMGNYMYIYLNGGGNGNQINVLATSWVSVLLIDAGVGTNNTIRIGSLSQGAGDLATHGGTLANIYGGVYPFDSSGGYNLVVDDQADTAAHPNVSLAFTQIDGLAPGLIHYALANRLVHCLRRQRPTVWNVNGISAGFTAEALYTAPETIPSTST